MTGLGIHQASKTSGYHVFKLLGSLAEKLTVHCFAACFFLLCPLYTATDKMLEVFVLGMTAMLNVLTSDVVRCWMGTRRLRLIMGHHHSGQK